MLRALCVLMAMDLASAEDTVGMLEQIVRSALNSAMIEYEYGAENQWFDMRFDLKGAVGNTNMTFLLYQNMICLSAYSPPQIKDEFCDLSPRWPTGRSSTGTSR